MSAFIAVTAVRAVRLSDGTIVAASALELFQDMLFACDDIPGALAALEKAAYREAWSRHLVAAAGHDWATHFVKFDGTVSARRGGDHA